jgi:peptide/nickel transport system substrate-binding protein
MPIHLPGFRPTRLLLAAGLSLLCHHTLAESVLRVGMTLSDIPVTTSQPNQGSEGWRFIGVTLYDSLINWDLSSADKPTSLVPGLATEWHADPKDRRVWTFKLRPGVSFHDGTPWNADAAIWNLDKLIKKDAPQYDPAQVAQTFGRLNDVIDYRKVDDLTITLTTRTPDSMVPYYFPRIFFASPTRWKETGSWAEFAKRPAGTGPFKLDKLVPRERAELLKNASYWDAKRVPKVDRLVLLPLPDAMTRTSALLSGQVDWIEAPSPDMIPRLKAAKMQVITNIYPHVWPYQLNLRSESPFSDIRVRKAITLTIDRPQVAALMNGTAIPAVGLVPPGHPWFGNPSFKVTYDPEQTKKLLAEAGYGPGKPLKLKFMISTSGSGQMQPLPMNEVIQAQLKKIGVDVSFDVVDWGSMVTRRAAGAQAPENKGIDAVANSWSAVDPDFGLIGVLSSDKAAPKGNNYGHVSNKKFDELIAAIRSEFDPVKQDQAVARLHAAAVDEAVWIWVVHDLNPRALSPKVKGFVQAQHWIQDLTSVSIQN